MNTTSLSFLLFILAVVSTLLIEKAIIPLLSKKAKQPIYEEGPSWHISKNGTPTMGGIGFVLPICLIILLLGLYYISEGIRERGLSLIVITSYALLNSCIGVFDDIVKLRRQKNGGLTPIQKLVLQSLVAILFLMTRKYLFDDSTSMRFSFGTIDFGVLYYPISMVILVGIVNCANLTDGIDGLASWVSITISVMIILLYNNTEASLICIPIIGAMLAFLFFNSNPAKIFMGDTGSLFLGAILSSLGFCIDNPFSSVLFGGVYVIEGISVILQVAFFKLTKKRLFRMAPLHHHYEKCGLSENSICVSAIIVTVILSYIGNLIIGR